MLILLEIKIARYLMEKFVNYIVPFNISCEFRIIVLSINKLRLISSIHCHVECKNIVLQKTLLNHAVHNWASKFSHCWVCKSNNSIILGIKDLTFCDETNSLLLYANLTLNFSSNAESIVTKVTF